MRVYRLLFLFSIITTAGVVRGQRLASGDYDFGLRLAFDSLTNKLTGYYANESGWDETTKSPRFSCGFYIEGAVAGSKVTISTYDPGYRKDDEITGTLEIVDGKNIRIRLASDHGGCGMVHSFAGDPTDFTLERSGSWTQIRYIIPARVHFCSDKKEQTKLPAYLLQNNIVFVGKTDGPWAYCTFYGKKTTSGWLKIADLNPL